MWGTGALSLLALRRGAVGVSPGGAAASALAANLLPLPLEAPRSRAFSTLRPIQNCQKTERAVAGRFGVEWFGGRRPTEINVQMPELPKKGFDGRPYSLAFRKYPGVASGLGAEYFMREGQKHALTYYHIRSASGDGDVVAVGSTSERAREARTIDNYVKERTRGFAVQINLEGRGVKAYFEPKSPRLMVRLGVGAKVRDLTQYCTRDPDCDVTLNKKGDIVVVHGPTKGRVGTLAYRLLKKMQPRLMPYTGKGAHFAFHPTEKKQVRKK